MRFGYKRVSSVEQNLARQDLGDVERIFEDKISGKDTNRAALQEMIGFVRSGDEVVVHSIDRLARDLRDLQDIIKQLNDKGVAKVDGVYFIGLPWLSMRGSSFIWGVWQDAKYLAEQIVKKNNILS